ncbi:MAG: DUF1553 domain-containing protein [Bryobacteraceae bacterium]
MRRLAYLILLGGAAWAQPRFERDVAPIFTANCFSCHGGTAMVGLDLRTAASIQRGSHQGPVLVKGDAAKSLLYQKLVSRQMPPTAFNFKVTDAQIEIVKQWIDGGALADERPSSLSPEQIQRFEKEVQPIFSAKCAGCHGTKPASGLDLRTLTSVLKGGGSGPVIVEGAADKSILSRRVSGRSMPPPGAGQPLAEAEIHAIRNWIDTSRLNVRDQSHGVRETFTAMEARPVTDKDKQAWPFRKPVAGPIPTARNKARVRNPIDAFILARLEEKGLSLSAEAPPPTLIRRVYLDLTGLPPSQEELKEALADTKPGAYERLVDRLLDSPHFGERWARYWLDAAGYVDVSGFDNDLNPYEAFDGIWRYRDYVVKSFNDDKPYDRFLVEQLAGDELVDWRNAKRYTPEIVESLVATGYVRSVFDRTDPDIVNLPGERFDVLFHLMEKVSTHVMGLTVGCARCHSHKYDPIPQRDYYRMLSVFTNAYNPWNWKQPKNRYLHHVSKEEESEIKKHNEEIERPLKRLREELSRLRSPYEEKLLDRKLQALPASIRPETRQAIATPDDKRDEVQKFLARKFEGMVKVKPEEVDKTLNEADQAQNAKLAAQIKQLESYRRPIEKIQALWDVGAPPRMRLLQRGVVESPGPTVHPGALTVLGAGEDFVRPPQAKGETSGARLAFAQWLTSPEHPLTARVIVNRLWQHHFGKGIVETVENFGKLGTPPTHPELLDWLAVDFMKNGWKLKRLHRMMVVSSAYRQSARQPADANALARKADPDNHLLWRMNLRRLEAEALRDAILIATGQLDRPVGGPPVVLKPRPDGLQDLVEKDGKHRRSLYIAQRRNYPLQLLQVFDFPTIQVNCNRRVNSATPLQSLAMLNDEFVVAQGRELAKRLEAASADADKQIELAYQLTLSRPPAPEEVTLCRRHLEKQKEHYLFGNATPEQAAHRALASLAQMLFSTNEFLYFE